MRMFLAAATAVAFSTLPLPAEETSPGDRLAKIVAPYVDAQTLLVVHADVMAFEVPEAIETVARLFAWPDATRDFMKAQAAPIDLVTQTQPAGSTVDVFVVASLSDIARLPFFLVLPLDKTTPAAAIAIEIRRDIEREWRRPVVTEPLGDALVIGSPETIKRLKKSRPAARPEIVAAFDATADSAVQIALVPSADLRKVVEGLMPQLPAPLGGGPTKAFTDGLVWGAIGIDLPPADPALHLLVQSTSPQAAQALEQEVARSFAAIGKLELVQNNTERFDELSKHLLPVASGDQLRLDLGEDNDGITALTTILGPLVRALYANAPAR